MPTEDPICTSCNAIPTTQETNVSCQNCTSSTSSGCCQEECCTPLTEVSAGRAMVVSDYAHCQRTLANLAHAIPYQLQSGQIDWRDGSADKPISFPEMQVKTGGFNYLFVGDSSKELFALEPNRALGDSVLEYSAEMDAFIFKQKPEDDPCGVCDNTASVTEVDPADVPAQAGDEVEEGLVTYVKTTSNGVTKYAQRLVDKSTILNDNCVPKSTITVPGESETTYRAIWRSKNTGVVECECLELSYEATPDSEYRKAMLTTPVKTAVPIDTISTGNATGGTETFDFTTLAVAQPSWANRVIVRVSVTNDVGEFDASNLYATAYVATGTVDLAAARLTAENESDASHSGDVSLPISGTGFQLVTGSGIVNGSGSLASNADSLFNAQVAIMGFELVESL